MSNKSRLILLTEPREKYTLPMRVIAVGMLNRIPKKNYQAVKEMDLTEFGTEVRIYLKSILSSKLEGNPRVIIPAYKKIKELLIEYITEIEKQNEHSEKRTDTDG